MLEVLGLGLRRGFGHLEKRTPKDPQPLNPKPEKPLKPQALNPKPQTLNPTPQTLNLQPRKLQGGISHMYAFLGLQGSKVALFALTRGG